MLPYPSNLPERYEFIAALCGGVFVTPRELCDRWRLSIGSLQNARSNGTSVIPWINLTGGAVRYRLSDILWWEVSHTNGALSPDRVGAELAAMPEVPPPLVAKIVARLKAMETPLAGYATSPPAPRPAPIQSPSAPTVPRPRGRPRSGER